MCIIHHIDLFVKRFWFFWSQAKTICCKCWSNSDPNMAPESTS